MKKNKIFKFISRFYLPILSVIIGVAIYFIFNIGSQILFLEYEDSFTEKSSYYHSIEENDIIMQDFKMIYPIFSGVKVRTGTAGVDNNSIWQISIYNKATNKQIYSWTQNATEFVEKNDFYFETKNPISVSTESTYCLTIKYLSGERPSEILFFTDRSANSGFVGSSNFSNGDTLSFSLYGGQKDTLIIQVYIVFTILIIALLTFFAYKQISIKGNIYIEAIALGIVCFVLMSFYINSNIRFSDEFDNVTAGLVMRHGRVLYKQYVSQHPPATMFLSALFAFLGAETVPQFRLFYYIIMSLGWVFIYIRNKKEFGGFKLVLLSIVSSSFIFVYNQGYYFLADGISGMCMTVLFFEFFRYAQTKKIDIIMSVAVAISVYFSFASNFLMIYPIFIIVIGFILTEINVIRSEKNINIRFFFNRYFIFLLFLLLPFILTFAYFLFNNALLDMIDQVYLFNTEVYPYYMGGLGENKITIIFECLKTFIQIPATMISNFLLGKDVFISLVFLGLYFFIIFSFYKLIKLNKKIVGIIFLGFIILMLVRSNSSLNEFHGIGANYILFASLIIGIRLIDFPIINYKKVIYMFIISTFLISDIYLSSIINIMNEKPEPITSSQKYIVQNLNSEDNIFVDYYIIDSTYLIYMGYVPVNRTPYLLPWYQDWYEEWSIEDINVYNPKIIIYDDDIDVWGHKNFNMALANKIKNEYTEVQENIWIRIN